MRYIYGIAIAILLLTIFEYSRKKNKDLFSPLCIFAVMQFLFYIPSIMFATMEYNQVFDDMKLFPVFIFEIFFIISVLFGYYAPRIKISNTIDVDNSEINSYEIVPKLSFVIPIYLLGFSAKIFTVVRSGGVLAIVQNPALAYLSLTSGSGYLEIMKYFAYTSIILMIYRFSRTRHKNDIIITVIMLIGYIFLDLVYSRRSITLTFGIIILFSANYFFKRIHIRTIFKPKLMLLILLLSAIIVVLPNIRSGNFFENDIKVSEISILESVNDMTTRFSMVGRDSFVYNNFNSGNHWLGKSYFNLPVSFIPSKIWTGKPPVDEGVYLTNLINGFQVSPNQSFKSLPIKFSIPFTSQGLLYANFGVVGIILGGMIIGYVYRSSYNKIKRDNPSVFDYIVYRMVIFEFGLTVMMLTNMIIQLLIIKIISLLFYNTKQSKFQKKYHQKGREHGKIQDYNKW